MTLIISVITASFNRVGTIAEALASVQGQTWKQIEHIVIDGASNDGTLQVIEAQRSRVSALVSERDGGLYDAVNKGYARATGDVVGPIHSDDFYADDRVLERVAAAFTDPAIDGVYGDLDYVLKADASRVVRRWRAGAYSRAALARGWMPPHPTLYLRRAVFEKWGHFDTSFRIAADYDAMLRYLWQGRIRLAYLPEVLVKMRVGGESNRSLSNIVRKTREDYRALRRNGVGGLGTLALKILSKLKQFVVR